MYNKFVQKPMHMKEGKMKNKREIVKVADYQDYINVEKYTITIWQNVEEDDENTFTFEMEKTNDDNVTTEITKITYANIDDAEHTFDDASEYLKNIAGLLRFTDYWDTQVSEEEKYWNDKTKEMTEYFDLQKRELDAYWKKVNKEFKEEWEERQRKIKNELSDLTNTTADLTIKTDNTFDDLDLNGFDDDEKGKTFILEQETGENTFFRIVLTEHNGKTNIIKKWIETFNNSNDHKTNFLIENITIADNIYKVKERYLEQGYEQIVAS